MAWEKLLTFKTYNKGEHFISLGQYPRKVGFVSKGLLSQNFIAADGSVLIKHFFPEQRFATSLVAMLTGKPSDYYITAIEKASIIEYDFASFKNLFVPFPDIALFYIAYNELHWIIEKEPLEISFKNETAPEKYQRFVQKHPDLIKRLKKHHIAAYLGITPTQLSRILGK